MLVDMLKRNFRITKQKEFDAFFGVGFRKRRGINASGGFLILKAFANGLKNSRFGIMVANKVDNRATVRNLAKRRIREVIRIKQGELKSGFDVLIIAKPEVKKKEYHEVEKELLFLLRRARLL